MEDLRRWLAVLRRAMLIAFWSLVSLGLIAASLAILWSLIKFSATAGDWRTGSSIALLLVLPLGAIGARLGWLCYKETTALTAKDPAPSALTIASPSPFLSFMIVMACLGILFSIAIPCFSPLIRLSGEGASKGNLGSIRSALSIYYGDMKGQYPSNLQALTIGGKYLAAIPSAKAPNYHPDSSGVLYGTKPSDAGGWLYNNVPGDRNTGSVMVNCTHTDTKGSVWSSY